ncbi:MAG: Crp/Fnr family transcriptional regulator [Flavobacteriaceae bacterium]
MIDIEKLKSVNHFFNKDLLTEISTHGNLKSFGKNEIIIDIGQKLEFVPILINGNIKVSRDDNDSEILLYVLESGDTCAMSLTCCLSNRSSKIRAVTDKPSEVIMISIEKMQEWMSKYEDWRNFILQSYQTRFNEMLETIDTLAFMKMDERLYKYLIDQVKLNASEIIESTHQNIAEDLNTSRVVISRLLKQLEIDGKIKLGRNKIEVLTF